MPFHLSPQVGRGRPPERCESDRVRGRTIVQRPVLPHVLTQRSAIVGIRRSLPRLQVSFEAEKIEAPIRRSTALKPGISFAVCILVAGNGG